MLPQWTVLVYSPRRGHLLRSLEAVLRSEFNIASQFCHTGVELEKSLSATGHRVALFCCEEIPPLTRALLSRGEVEIPVLFATAETSINSPAIAALPDFVRDIVVAPFRPAELAWKLNRLFSQQQPPQGRACPRHPHETFLRNQLVGKAPPFTAALNKLFIVADSEATVLLSGETGVGKELCARLLHYDSQRSGKPMVSVNCGSLPNALFENELFGHVKGAFTDARNSQTGLVKEARGGTLFLDEIEALSPPAQSALLRLLEAKTYRPLGQSKEISADIRIVAASNVQLSDRVAQGLFRADLYYRFNIVVEIPPLRKRAADLPLLATHFIRKFCKAHHKPQKSLSKPALAKLTNYDWPGNVRELENVIQEAILLTHAAELSADHLRIHQKSTNRSLSHLPFNQAKKKVLERFEKDYLKRLLQVTCGNISEAARQAQKDRSDLGKLIRKHDIDPAAFGGQL